MMFRIALCALVASPAYANPLLPLPAGGVNATLHLEQDVSSGQLGELVSLAPDLAVGVTRELTLSLVHSTFGRTGFRGAAGSGLCASDACARTYDNAGVEALYTLRRGSLAIAGNAGVHATSLHRDFYVAKLGGKLRLQRGRLAITSAPSVFVAATERDAMSPNRDRLWLPVVASVRAGNGVAVGATTGFKAPLDDVGGAYEVAAGVMIQYTPSSELSFGASWVHGKLVAGDALPADTTGFDSRALHIWISATR
jgi:hypothetical protein